MKESDVEILREIVIERSDKIQAEALEQIKQIQEDRENRLDRIIPDLLKQIENFSVFKLLDVLDVIRDGGVVKTGECGIEYDRTNWRLTIGNMDPFYDDNMYQRGLVKGRYRITLIMEKLEEAED